VRRGTLNNIPSIDLQLLTHSFDADWHHPEVGPLEGHVGFQWSYQDNDNQPGTNTVLFIPNYQNSRFGFYVNEQLEHGDNLFDFGIRYDYLNMNITGREQDNTLFSNTLTFQNFTATIGWERELSETWTLRTNLGTAWRPPNVFELYVFGKHQATIEYGIFRHQRNEDGTIDTNVILDENDKPIYSEVGYKWVTTASYRKNRTELEATGYVNYIKDYIYATPAGITLTVRGAFPFFVYDQTDALLAGVDGTLRIYHNPRLTSHAKASFVYARDVSNSDYFVEIPPLKLNYGIEYQFSPQRDLRLKADFTYLFRQFMYPEVVPVEEFLEPPQPDPDGNFDFMDAPDGTLLVNVGLFRSGEKFSYSVEVNNLFNQSYRLNTDTFRYFADQAGINIQARVQFNF
jgi:iron complex outermembrane receptor protein